jgi:hypothetical protein
MRYQQIQAAEAPDRSDRWLAIERHGSDAHTDLLDFRILEGGYEATGTSDYVDDRRGIDAQTHRSWIETLVDQSR